MKKLPYGEVYIGGGSCKSLGVAGYFVLFLDRKKKKIKARPH